MKLGGKNFTRTVVTAGLGALLLGLGASVSAGPKLATLSGFGTGVAAWELAGAGNGAAAVAIRIILPEDPEVVVEDFLPFDLAVTVDGFYQYELTPEKRNADTGCAEKTNGKADPNGRALGVDTSARCLSGKSFQIQSGNFLVADGVIVDPDEGGE